jgi:ubiquinone biosynthesis protein
MIFVHGFVHGDLHPGNVSVATSGQVILFDYGLVAALTESDRVLFRDFFLAVAMGDAATAARNILLSAERRPLKLDLDKFERAVAALLKRYSGQKAGGFLVARFVSETFALQRRFGLCGAPGFANAVWALAMFEGLVRQGYPSLDFQMEARPFLVRALIEKMKVLAPLN